MPGFASLRLLLFYICLMFFVNVYAQLPSYSTDSLTSERIIVEDVLVFGNKDTKESIILRELLIAKGDTIHGTELGILINKSCENILKTSLFHYVTIDVLPYPDTINSSNSTTLNTDSIENYAHVQYYKSGVESRFIHKILVITVTERWYWWIWPMLEYPDRNFNDWWQHHDLSRLSAGLFFQHENAGGRLEKLNIKAMAGYRTLLEASYEWPYINKSKSVGIGLFTSYSTQHEINYITQDNKQLFYHGHQLMLRTASVATNVHYRPGTRITHYLSFQYTSLQMEDSIRYLNPEYLLTERSNPQYFSISYLLKADYRDNRAYPLKGYYMETELTHLFNLNEAYNQQSARTSLRGYLPVSRNLYAASEFTLRLTNPEIKPYYLQNVMGFDRNYVRGYEYMVIEGPHYWIFKSHAMMNILPLKTIRIPFIRSEKFNTIPLSIFTGPHFDAGQSFPAIKRIDNSYQNQLLMGYGLGIDLVTYYDKVFRIEYTFRHDGASGFFLHFMAAI